MSKILSVKTIFTSILFSFFINTAHAVVVNPTEDVMTSSFFFAPNSVRGYAGEGRTVFRVSSDNPFGSPGAETIYLSFDPSDFNNFSGPVSASLTMESVSGGFNADAGAGNPFTVSAHALTADPIANITDDTNPAGPINWLDFYNNNILAADSAASTVIDTFGTVTFDVSAIVNDWIAGSNSIFALALTGLNDTSGNDFLHGFLNNSETPGSSFLSVSAVPVPAAVWLFASALLGLVGVSRKNSVS